MNHYQSFNYIQVGKDLIDQLLCHVLKGESAILLGSRFSGKRYVLARLTALLRSRDCVVVRLGLLENPPVATIEELMHAVEAAVREADPGLNMNTGKKASTDPKERLLTALDLLCSSDRHIVMLISNIDSMSARLSRSFLRALRR